MTFGAYGRHSFTTTMLPLGRLLYMMMQLLQMISISMPPAISAVFNPYPWALINPGYSLKLILNIYTSLFWASAPFSSWIVCNWNIDFEEWRRIVLRKSDVLPACPAYGGCVRWMMLACCGARHPTLCEVRALHRGDVFHNFLHTEAFVVQLKGSSICPTLLVYGEG